MAATNINRVVLTGNLTRDPELRSTNSGMSVCSLRVACNTRQGPATGDWDDKPNFFDVTVWGAQGENCARFLAKGRPVAIDGRLEWREWQDRGTATSARRSTSSPTPCSSSAAAMTRAAAATASRRGPTSPPTRATSSPPARLPPAAAATAAEDDIPF